MWQKKLHVSIIKADIGGYVGHSDIHDSIREKAHDDTPTRFDGPPRVVALGFQLAEGELIGPRDMFADKSYNRAREIALYIADYIRMHGPFEPHRLPADEIEYTTMPQLMEKLKDRFESLE